MISSPVIGPDGTIYTGSVWQETLTPSSWIYAINPDGTLKWRFRTAWRDYQTASTPAIGPQGQVFVGAADGSFYAIGPQGNQLWVHHAEKPVETHPVVFGDRVYVNHEGKRTAF
jgi:outer membrane protein assembly factor BamB